MKITFITRLDQMTDGDMLTDQIVAVLLVHSTQLSLEVVSDLNRRATSARPSISTMTRVRVAVPRLCGRRAVVADHAHRRTSLVTIDVIIRLVVVRDVFPKVAKTLDALLVVERRKHAVQGRNTRDLALPVMRKARLEERIMVTHVT